MNLRRRGLLGLSAACIAAGALTGPVPAAGAATTVVNPGQSIQAALDAAQPGATIRVRPGLYREYLQIDTDDVTLRGDGAVLQPPTDPAAPRNACSEGGANIGICIIGDLAAPPSPDAFPEFSRLRRDVTVRGFVVQGWDTGIFAFGNDGTEIAHNVLVDNTEYGAFANTSTGTWLHHNTASGSAEAGLYVGDSAHADATVEHNVLHDNLFGIFWRDAAGGEISHNIVTGNCAGLLVLDTPAPTTGGSVDVEHNTFSANNKACAGAPDEEEAPPVSGIGVLLVDAQRVHLEDNKLRGNVPTGPTPASGGVVLLPFADPSAGLQTRDNRIEDNTIRDNAPFDIDADGVAALNSFDDNRCRTSNPDGLC